ncbi:MAG: hypothetical protein CFH01_00856 [Alphaproteobacteria bacterium MarineAlpha2_Bin1]|nr:hypothetical protein [Rhodospirillaceae bacterium]PPR78655.1 MAG: hypothetical protein CFH01_00856 [Alphaproteobacteria bacterium MarineAlpha2_Bin1]
MIKLTDEETRTINNIMEKLGIEPVKDKWKLMDSLIYDGYKKVLELSKAYKSDEDLKTAASLLKDILFFEYLAYKRISPKESENALKIYVDFDEEDTKGFLLHAPKLEFIIAAIEKQMSDKKIN